MGAIWISIHWSICSGGSQCCHREQPEQSTAQDKKKTVKTTGYWKTENHNYTTAKRKSARATVRRLRTSRLEVINRQLKLILNGDGLPFDSKVLRRLDAIL